MEKNYNSDLVPLNSYYNADTLFDNNNDSNDKIEKASLELLKNPDGDYDENTIHFASKIGLISINDINENNYVGFNIRTIDELSYLLEKYKNHYNFTRFVNNSLSNILLISNICMNIGDVLQLYENYVSIVDVFSIDEFIHLVSYIDSVSRDCDYILQTIKIIKFIEIMTIKYSFVNSLSCNMENYNECIIKLIKINNYLVNFKQKYCLLQNYHKNGYMTEYIINNNYVYSKIQLNYICTILIDLPEINTINSSLYDFYYKMYYDIILHLLSYKDYVKNKENIQYILNVMQKNHLVSFMLTGVKQENKNIPEHLLPIIKNINTNSLHYTIRTIWKIIERRIIKINIYTLKQFNYGFNFSDYYRSVSNNKLIWCYFSKINSLKIPTWIGYDVHEKSTNNLETVMRFINTDNYEICNIYSKLCNSLKLRIRNLVYISHVLRKNEEYSYIGVNELLYYQIFLIIIECCGIKLELISPFE